MFAESRTSASSQGHSNVAPSAPEEPQLCGHNGQHERHEDKKFTADSHGRCVGFLLARCGGGRRQPAETPREGELISAADKRIPLEPNPKASRGSPSRAEPSRALHSLGGAVKPTVLLRSAGVRPGIWSGSKLPVGLGSEGKCARTTRILPNCELAAAANGS